jgi:hypothetical protein
MASEDNNNSEPTMGEKPETAQDRLEALELTVRNAKRARRAYELGFDSLDDYHQWNVLESLRNLTIESRAPGHRGQPPILGNPDKSFPIAG